MFWSRMGLNDEIAASDESVPEWLSTHPSHGKRVELFDFLVPKVSLALFFRRQKLVCIVLKVFRIIWVWMLCLDCTVPVVHE